MTITPNWKTTRADRKRATRKRRAALKRDERANKGIVRARDRRCRFPWCGCTRRGWRLEVSHDTHKGMGGDPTGERSQPAAMVLLCWHRHQLGHVSRHAGNLRVRFLSDRGYDGPVAWLITREALYALASRLLDEATVMPGWSNAPQDAEGFVELARERAVQDIEPPNQWQQMTLILLARMTM